MADTQNNLQKAELDQVEPPTKAHPLT